MPAITQYSSETFRNSIQLIQVANEFTIRHTSVHKKFHKHSETLYSLYKSPMNLQSDTHQFTKKFQRHSETLYNLYKSPMNLQSDTHQFTKIFRNIQKLYTTYTTRQPIHHKLYRQTFRNCIQLELYNFRNIKKLYTDELYNQTF